MKLAGLRKNIFLRPAQMPHGRTTVAARIVGCTAMVILGLATLAGDYGLAKAEDAGIASRRAAERHDFTDGEIRNGFFKVAFRAELQVGRSAERVRKFDGPVRIFIDSSQALPKRRAGITAIVADIGRRIDHLDLAIATDRREANFTVSLVADREMAATIRARYGRQSARRIEKSLNPQCLSGIGKDRQFRIRRAEVILPVDAGDFTFYDCAYEEILQGLGAINDDRSVPWTMFNDDVQMGFFDVFDQYLLNVLSDPRIRPGMTRDEVTKLLPEVLPAARTFVASTNSSDHARGHGRLGASAPRAWGRAILVNRLGST